MLMTKYLAPKSLTLRRYALSLGLAVAVTASAAVVRADDDDHCGGGGSGGCAAFAGPFGSVTVPVPPCTSPVGLCTHGLLTGAFPATYDFTFATLQNAGDPTDPTEFVYTGHSVVTTTSGVMNTNDSGVIHIPTSGAPAPFVTTAVVANGTGPYTSTTGEFVASGTLDFTTGDAVGSYVANLCGISHDHDHGHGHW
jgi:hypothetical protein